eukprot:1029847-Rhodomonas_salina.1
MNQALSASSTNLYGKATKVGSDPLHAERKLPAQSAQYWRRVRCQPPLHSRYTVCSTEVVQGEAGADRAYGAPGTVTDLPYGAGHHRTVRCTVAFSHSLEHSRYTLRGTNVQYTTATWYQELELG